MGKDIYILDASTLIDIWQRFPRDLKVFQQLWEQIEELVELEIIVVTRRNFEEVKSKSEEIHNHFKGLGIVILTPTQEILELAVNIQMELGITDAEIKNNLRKGVDEGDLFCVATAKIRQAILVTEESKQPVNSGNKGALPTNYKIPRVCALSSVNVECINFLELLDLIKNL
ncbi:DUF4411 family protein [Acinetobacter wuhouensis]|uniref:DUF4411 family protein n=1 Tax=Acinetobacter TaxID=469 RepID=UPI000839DA7B|nr:MULTISPECIES: DUF4411 family protein [Acinetobacter]AXQ23352.1 DUF4411 family protein [Acinetobacter wuhouensis]RZG87244.1 DUF4411 family protein [Acinetobacter sp. WCHAc060033]